AGAFTSAGKTGAGDRPLFRAGKTVAKRINGGESHRAAPCRSIAARTLRPVSGEHHPSFRQSDPAIEIGEIITILTFVITRGTDHQYRPGSLWIKIGRRCEHR